MSSDKKLPIYDDPEEVKGLVRDPFSFQDKVATGRAHTAMTIDMIKESINEQTTKWFGFEADIEKTIHAIVPPNERLSPAWLYVGVAALGGLIFSRRRNIVLRSLTSTAFGLTAVAALLPGTGHNLDQRAVSLERKYFPDVASRHEQVTGAISEKWHALAKQVREAASK